MLQAERGREAEQLRLQRSRSEACLRSCRCCPHLRCSPRLLVDCNQLAVDIDNEIVVVYNFIRDKASRGFCIRCLVCMLQQCVVLTLLVPYNSAEPRLPSATLTHPTTCYLIPPAVQDQVPGAGEPGAQPAGVCARGAGGWAAGRKEGAHGPALFSRCQQCQHVPWALHCPPSTTLVAYEAARPPSPAAYPPLYPLTPLGLGHPLPQAIGNEMDVTLVDLDRLLPPATVMVVTVTATTTSGKPLSQEDLK